MPETQPMGAGSPPRRPPTAIGVAQPDDRYEQILEAIDRLTIRQLRQLTIDIQLRLEFKGRKRA